MHCYWRGIRFLSTTTRSKRNNWDPTVSLELNHPSLVLLEKSNTRDHFKQILGQMMRSNLIGQTFPMSRLIFFSAISHPENLDMALLLFNHFTPNPNLYIYNTMISALSLATNQSFVVYNSMLSSGIDPDKHTLLNLLHAANGRWSYSDKIRETMESRGVKKTAGCSSVVIDGVIHDFVAADKWHPRWMEVKFILNCLSSELKLGADVLVESMHPLQETC